MASSLPPRVKGPDTAWGQGRALLLTLVLLLVLTSLSWWLAHVPLGAFHSVVALGIAVIKAGSVGLVFMELDRSGLVPRFIAFVTFVFIALLCGGVVGDALLR